MKLAYCDSCIWIARFEGLASYKKIIVRHLRELADEKWTFCSSDLVSLEVLLKPLQSNETALAQKYRTFLTTLKALENYPHLFKDALLIAQNENLKAVDAFHVAMAEYHNCTLFVTSDPHFKNLKTITPSWIDLSSP
jgi:predicted nucleic acid-binding protein